MQTDYFISFAEDVIRVNDMVAYNPEISKRLTVCKVFLQKKVVMLEHKNKILELTDIGDCDLHSVDSVLGLIKEYYEDFKYDPEYESYMLHYKFHNLNMDGTETTYINETQHTAEDEDPDTGDYLSIVDNGARIREEDNYATLKMMVTSMKEEYGHKIDSISQRVDQMIEDYKTFDADLTTLENNMQKISDQVQYLSTVVEESRTDNADSITNYIDDRIKVLKTEIGEQLRTISNLKSLLN